MLDFLVDISSVDNRDPEKEEISKGRVRQLVDAWRQRDPTSMSSDTIADPKRSIDTSSSNLGNNDVVLRDKNEINGEDKGTLTIPGHEDQRRPGFLRQTKVLSARAHRNVYRNTPQLFGLLGQAVVLGLIYGFTFYRLPEVGTLPYLVGRSAEE